MPEEHNNIGTLHQYFSRYGDIQKVNVDLSKRSALVKFKAIESAEAAASAYLNKSKDEHILGVPQIRVKYVTQQAGNENRQEELKEPRSGLTLQRSNSSQVSSSPIEDEASKKKQVFEQRKAQIEQYNTDIQKQVRRLTLEGASLSA